MKKDRKIVITETTIANVGKVTPSKNQARHKGLLRFFNHFSAVVTRVTGGPTAFMLAVLIILVWAVTGPIFKFSDTWQLVINTGTTIITFLMVFVIQHSQNKDTTALQLKLDELISASKASNKLINIENLDDDEIEKFRKFYAHLSETAEAEKEDRKSEKAARERNHKEKDQDPL